MKAAPSARGSKPETTPHEGGRLLPDAAAVPTSAPSVPNARCTTLTRRSARFVVATEHFVGPRDADDAASRRRISIRRYSPSSAAMPGRACSRPRRFPRAALWDRCDHARFTIVEPSLLQWVEPVRSVFRPSLRIARSAMFSSFDFRGGEISVRNSGCGCEQQFDGEIKPPTP